MKRRNIAALAACLMMAAAGVNAQSEIIHEERSLYRDIVVTQDGDRRCMQFDVRYAAMNQSCMDLGDRQRLVFDYAQMSFAGLLINPEPRRVLIAGLGGGSIPSLMHEEFPDTGIDVVEVDPAVVRVAKEYFDFRETERMEVHEADARVFIKRAGLRDESYDYILLDAFSEEYIPEHLLTREFLQEVKQLLTDDGVLVANTFATSRLYDHESETYRDVFGEFYNFQRAGTGNRIIVATKGELPSRGELRGPARELHDRLEPFGVRLMEYPARLSTEPDWDTSARVLTDQYSPANLLN